MNRAQAKEAKRLVEDEGLTPEQAEALVTQVQLDVPLGRDGRDLAPSAPRPTPVKIPESS